MDRSRGPQLLSQVKENYNEELNNTPDQVTSFLNSTFNGNVQQEAGYSPEENV